MNTINHCLKQAVDRQKEKALFIQPSSGETLTFSGFAEAMGGVHRVLAQHRVGPGDVVTLIAANSIDLAVMLYGVMTFGAIAKPLNPQITSVELEKLLSHSGSSIIFADRRIAIPQYQGKYLDINTYRQSGSEGYFVSGVEREDSAALLIYTSGTTSRPKGVLLSHRNIVHNVLTAMRFFEL